jgi:uncharacterized membrane protein
MADMDYSFVVIRFPSVERAEQGLHDIQQLQKEKAIKPKDMVIVSKTEDGKLQLHKTKSVGKSALKVGVAGLIVGAAVGGPVIWAAAGAVAGGMARWAQGPIKDDLAKEFGEKLEVGQAALCALVSEYDIAEVRSRLKAQYPDTELLAHELPEKDVNLLDQALDTGDLYLETNQFGHLGVIAA